MEVLKQSIAYVKDIDLHPRVRVELVVVDSTNEADMLSIVMHINKLNEMGFADIDKKVGRKAWYNVPMALMSQLLHPEKYTLALKRSLPRRIECFLQRDDWWRTLRTIEWTNRPKGGQSIDGCKKKMPLQMVAKA
ncbi:hypothetical protein GOP47_0028384 [Adiantum capillus-veneris]|nr:hypothetical protein GOP47_0028384 [Adiantum capillus-veneris]